MNLSDPLSDRKVKKTTEVFTLRSFFIDFFLGIFVFYRSSSKAELFAYAVLLASKKSVLIIFALL